MNAAPAPDSTVTITLFAHVRDPHGERKSLSWPEFVERFREQRRVPLASLRRDGEKWEKPDDLAGWSAATFREDRRAADNVERVCALAFDIDGGATASAALAGFDGLAAFAHASFNSTSDAPRCRVVALLSRPVTREQYAQVWREEAARLASLDIVADEKTKDASRFWFAPAMPDGAPYEFAASTGAPLDVDKILSVARERPAGERREPLRLIASTPSTDVDGHRSMAERERRATAYAAKLDPAISGQGGHNTAFSAALKVATGFDLDEDAAMRALASWNARCEPPWSEAELRHKVRDALSKGRAVERGAMLRERATGGRGAPPDWDALVTPASAEWFETPPPTRTWLLRDSRVNGEGVSPYLRERSNGVLPLGKVGQLVAEGGAGKTMALVQLAVAVATGTRWLGTLDVATSGRVLLILAEEDREEVQRRLFNARAATNTTTPAEDAIVTLPLAGVTCPLVESDSAGNPRDTDFAGWLRGYVAEHEPFKLVVVDPLSRFAGLDAEKDNASGTRFVQALESLAKVSGATVLVAHHTNKLSRGGGRVAAHDGRGSTSLVDGVRWAASLTRDEIEGVGKVVTLSFCKSNYGPLADDVALRYDANHGGALVPLDQTETSAVSEARSGSALRAARATQKKMETEAKERDETEKRAARAASKAAEKAAERLAEERALVEVLRAETGITSEMLRSALAARLDGCDRNHMNDIIARLGTAVVKSRPPRGPSNAVAHSLDESRLPEHLR